MRALLVDDDHELRLATRALLENSGYRILEASRGLHALDLVESRDVDLLVIGLSMPGMDGLTLADQVTEKLYDRDLSPAVLLMSNDCHYPRLQKRMVEGGMAFLRKPFSASELTAEIDTAFARKEQLLSLTEERLLAQEEKVTSGPPIATESPELVAAPDLLRLVPAPAAAASAAPKAGAENGSASADTVTATRRQPAWRRTAWSLAAAAVLVLTISGTLRTLDQSPPPLPPPPSKTTLRSAVIEGIEPMGSISETPSAFRWQETTGRDSYRLEVRAVDDQVLWSGTSKAPVLEVPPELAELLHSAVTYTWSVEARDVSGARVAWSPPIEFRMSADMEHSSSASAAATADK